MMLGDFFTDCTLMARTVTEDGFGSVTETWQDGTDIRAGIIRNSSTEAQLAYRTGAKELYTIVTDGVDLHQHDRIQRVSDGRIFRVTSDSRPAPAPASIAYRQADAEVIQ